MLVPEPFSRTSWRRLERYGSVFKGISKSAWALASPCNTLHD